MIKINRYYPSKPFYEMTIKELQKFVKLQNYKDKKNNKKKRKRKKGKQEEDIITKIKHVKI